MIFARLRYRRRSLQVLLPLLAFVLVGAPFASIPNSLAGQVAPAAVSLDQFGGHPGLRGSATGYFSKAQLSSGGQTRWWLVDPFGNAYFANGLNLVSPDGLVDVDGNNPYRSTMYERYGNPINGGTWASEVEDRLRAWGYNALGSWSAGALYAKLPHTVELSPIRASVDRLNPTRDRNLDTYPILYEESRPDWDAMYRRYFFDVFHPTWDEEASNHIISNITSNSYAGSQNLLGYFADNEVPVWHGRSTNPASPWYTNNTLADVFIALPPTAYGKIEWVNFLRGIYPNIASLNAAWGGASYGSFDDLLAVSSVPNTNTNRQTDKLGFLQRIVGKYFSTIKNAIRSVDQNHLYLGNRFVTGGVSTPYGVYVEAGKYLDVVSVNYYIWENLSYSVMKTQLDTALNTIYEQSGKPLLITEFSFAARDSGMPATNLNGALVDTQEQRAQLYIDYRRVAAESPNVVGVYWWSYFDPPPAGNRVGLENSNLGLVNNSDRPYLRLLYRTSQQSANAYAYRGLEAPSGPVLSGARASVVYSPLALDLSSLQTSEPASAVYAGLLKSSDLAHPESRHGGLPTRRYPELIGRPPRLDGSSVGAPASVTREAAGSPLTNGYRLYLPVVTKNSVGLPQTTFYFTLAGAVSSATIEIYEGVSAAATLKRTLSLSGPLAAGNQSYRWDGLDQNGIEVGSGSFFFVMKVATASGQKDYALGAFTR